MHVVNCLEEAFHIRFTEDALYDIETCRDLVGYIAAKTAPARQGRAPVTAATPPPKSAVAAERSIAPECYDVERFPECVALAERLAGTAAVGLENPFFRVKQRVERATVQIDGCQLISYTSFDWTRTWHPSWA